MKVKSGKWNWWLDMDKFVWPEGEQKIEYGYLDMDNHILYREDNKSEMDKLRKYFSSKPDKALWLNAWSKNMCQCVYAFSFELNKLGTNFSRTSVYVVINQMIKDGKIK